MAGVLQESNAAAALNTPDPSAGYRAAPRKRLTGRQPDTEALPSAGGEVRTGAV